MSGRKLTRWNGNILVRGRHDRQQAKLKENYAIEERRNRLLSEDDRQKKKSNRVITSLINFYT
jgi:hypothetical protein